MKILFCLLTAGAICFTACENVNTTANIPETPTQEVSPDSPDFLPLKGIVLDGDGELLGYAVSTSVAWLNVITTEAYLVTLGWDGSVLQSVSMYFPEPYYNGTPFALYTENYSPYGRSLWQVDDVFWTFADSAEGYAVPLEEPHTEYQSMILNEHTRIDNYSGNVTGTNQSYELTTIEYETAGLPELIIPPLTLSWE